MKKHADFLVEILTEELPPKSLLKLAQAFCQQIKERLEKLDLSFGEVKFFATPRRLAVLVTNLAAAQKDQVVERKGPALNAAFDAAGKPTPACAGFAKSCGVTPDKLQTIKTAQGEWVGLQQHVAGKSVNELLPDVVEQAAIALPIPKRMRWGGGDTQFVRPVHSVAMLFGENIINATVLACKTGRETRGHRFHAPNEISIPNASAYAELLESKAHVVADFATRREMIREQAIECVQTNLGDKARILISSDELLNEVTGLVEWPMALCGHFDKAFLQLPDEVLISSMQDHQRYFPVVDAKSGKLLANFITISNIQSHDVKQVIQGNERVLRARLSDAAFFYDTDKKESLEQRVPRLKDIVFQAKLGTVYEKTERVSKIADFIAEKLGVNREHAKRAALLAKTDLTTNMVNEFPELQGVMGCYYATHDSEPDDIAQAMKEQYMPRFSGDNLPVNPVGQVLALAERIDTLTGAFGINQIPTGDKDPFGLRRAALGVLRLLIEKKINLDLRTVLLQAYANYPKPLLENPDTINQVLDFLQDRLRSWYQEQGVTPDVFASVAALSITNPLDMHHRIKAVQAFKKLSEAETLSVANKRVSNILSKYVDVIDAKAIDPAFFEHEAEQELARQLAAKGKAVARLYQSGKYDEVLMELAELRAPIDDFFDHVMVMTEDKSQRENRLLLLKDLRALFLQVADIALLQ